MRFNLVIKLTKQLSAVARLLSSRPSLLPVSRRVHAGLLSLLGLGFAAAVVPVPSTAQSPPPADSLRLADVVAQVLETHPSLDAARREVNAATARVEQARSEYWPRVEVAGTYRRQDPVPEISVPGGLMPGDTGGERTIGIQPNNLYDGHLALRQTLYDFGRTGARVEHAKAGRMTMRRRSEVERSDLAFQAVNAFYATLLAEARMNVQHRQIEQLRRTLEVVRRRQDAGTATEFEIQSTRSRLSAARSRLAQFQSERQRQRAELRRLLGPDAANSLALTGSLRHPAVPRPPVEVDSLVDRALRHHPSVRVSQARVESARQQVRAADASDAPTLALTAQGGVKNGYPSDLNEPRLNESVGLSLTVPLFEGFATHRRVEEAEATAAAADARLADARRQVRTRVEQADATLRARRRQLETASTRVEEAQAAAQLARTRYEAGTVTNLELLEAETELQRARLDRTAAQYGVVMGRYALRRAAGTLLPFEPIQK